MADITVLLADDHTIVRQGLRALLSAQPGITVVGEAADGRAALDLAADLAPQVVLLDWMMPNLNGLEAARQLRARLPACQIVILSMHANVAYVVQALRSGVVGYVLKDQDAAEVVKAVRAAAAGRRYIDPALADRVMEAFIANETPSDDPFELLTEREREVLQMIAEGHTSAAIAGRLGISLRTVETHRANLKRKLDVRAQADLVRYALQHGLTEGDRS